ncbi:MAG: adenylate/guanylate cyclase domain-containing protein, partial [Chloroflexi bacterium]|nr:adenylate/guanylate cyclase domain-containing protein [Chloroflexota bacterium]
MVPLPSGTVTFLFSDVEGSTQLLERHGALMGEALSRHHDLFEQVVERHQGAIFETVGDAVYAAFARPQDAVAAALEAHRGLASEDWGPIGRIAVRIAVHTGAVERRGDHYFGPALFRCARLQVLGYGEQTLLSGVAARLVGDALPHGASLRDLGQHRLKDLGEPEQVHQLVHHDLRGDFPALKSLDTHPHNLPLALSSFVGRETELHALGELLDAKRLVTLIGPGGIGKTRLALQVAAEQIERHSDGVFVVDLAPLRDAALIAGTISITLGLREQAGQSISETLHEHLKSRRLLLLLDNLEQLLPTAARAVADLLVSAPGLHVLVTSRAPLRLRGEHEYRVPPLTAGKRDQLDTTPPPAVALFLERARAVQIDLVVDATAGPLIAEICECLDGLPLAIELAAARLRLLSLTALRERLAQRLPLLTAGSRDSPERQQTLRATIAWSEELLTPPQQQLFAQLGAFVGTFSLEAVEAVAAADLSGAVLDELGALVEHSLMRNADDPIGAPRFAMLETIREYALERLEARGEAADIRDRLAAYLVNLAEESEPRLTTREQTETLRQLDLELDDVRAALSWLRVRGDVQQLGRLAAALARYCTHRG